MGYGSVEGARSVKSTVDYLESSDPHNNKYVTDRNLNVWTSGIVGSPDDPLYDRMRMMLDANPNSRRKFEAYNFVVSYSKSEFDVEKKSEVEDMQHHVRQTCEKHFGNNVPYSVHIQADGDGGNLHAHVIALNIDLNTGKSIRGYSNLYRWRHNMNEVTREREEYNKSVEYPSKNAIVISANTACRKEQRGEQFQWHDELMDKIDFHFENTTALTYDDFRKELAGDGITLKQDEKGENTMSFKYAPAGGVTVNGKTRKSRRVKSSRLGTDYSSVGFKERFELRQREMLRLAGLDRERREREREEQLIDEIGSNPDILCKKNEDTSEVKEVSDETNEEKLLKEILRNQKQRSKPQNSYKGQDGLELF